MIEGDSLIDISFNVKNTNVMIQNLYGDFKVYKYNDVDVKCHVEEDRLVFKLINNEIDLLITLPEFEIERYVYNEAIVAKSHFVKIGIVFDGSVLPEKMRELLEEE